MKPQQRERLLGTLQQRFESNMRRHVDQSWRAVLARLEKSPGALAVLLAMEDSGGEPDVTCGDAARGRIVFCDCSAESPAGRRRLCYDRAALDSQRENKPRGSAVEAAAALGIELLTETHYRELQSLGEFDMTTSSWVATPEDVRSRGGALFCDRRYGRVFVYHNGAQSYYAARGFRGRLCV
jgi:hypothetical protein